MLWQIAILGLLGQQSLIQTGGALDSLLANVGNLVSWPAFNQAMHLFADLALATSFLGVTLGLFDFMAKVTRRKDNWQGRTQTGLITFVPPLLFALYFPQGFIMALGYAAIALAVLAVLLPVTLVWQSRKRAEAHHYRARAACWPWALPAPWGADRRGTDKRQHGIAARALSQSRYCMSQ